MNGTTDYWPRLLKPVEDDSLDRFISAMDQVLKKGNYGLPLSLYSQMCNRCQRCSQECQIFQQTGDIKDSPYCRTEKLLRFFRYHFFSQANGNTIWKRMKNSMDQEASSFNLKDLIETLYRCTLCRRCTEECPMGIDHRLVARFGRQVISEMGLVPQNMGGSAMEQIFGIGNTSAIPKNALIDAIEFLEEDIYDSYGMKCVIPLNKKNADYILFAPISDYMMEAETLMGIIMVMNQVGCDWTISTEYSDAINYGLFYDDRVLMTILDKLVQEVKRLQARTVVIGECGHATRAAFSYWKSHLETEGIEVKSILEITADALRNGQIHPDRSRNQQKVVIHDPCNIVRGCGIFKPQREILEACVGEYVEMQPNGRFNYCCGGGGSVVIAEDLYEFRVQNAGKVKADQIRDSDAEVVCAPCANCKKMLRELIDYYKLPVTVVGIHDLLANSLAVESSQQSESAAV